MGARKALAGVSSYSVVPTPLSSLTDSLHFLVVTGRTGDVLACGYLDSNGALITGLMPENDSTITGAVYFGSFDDEQTGVSLFLTGEALRVAVSVDAGASASSERADAGDIAEAEETAIAPTPIPAENVSSTPQVGGFAYEVIGILGRDSSRDPNYIAVRMRFKNVSGEDRSLPITDLEMEIFGERYPLTGLVGYDGSWQTGCGAAMINPTIPTGKEITQDVLLHVYGAVYIDTAVVVPG